MKLLKDITNSEIIDLLNKISIFGSLDEKELMIVVEYMDIVHAEKGEIIFKEGDRGDYVCFVVEGVLDVIKTTETGKYVVVSTLQKGRSIGEMSIMDNFPRSASVRARSNSVLFKLSHESFDHIVEEHPRIGISVMQGVARLLSQALRKTSERLTEYMLPIS